MTLDTVVEDPALLSAAVRTVLDAGANALVTTGFATKPENVEGTCDRVRVVPFAPIAQLLDRVQAVVTTGGSGTTLAALPRSTAGLRAAHVQPATQRGRSYGPGHPPHLKCSASVPPRTPCGQP